MTDGLQQQIARLYIRHAAWMTDGGLITCVCGRDKLLLSEHADHFAEVLITELGFTQVWYDDVAGPDWQQYSYWRTPTENHPGPKRIAAGLRASAIRVRPAETEHPDGRH